MDATAANAHLYQLRAHWGLNQARADAQRMQPASGARRPGNGLADTVVSVRTPDALKNVGWNACAAPQHRTAQDSAMSKVRILRGLLL